MLYLGIDLHRKQMTVSLRNELGDVVLRRQVSTRWKKVDEFLEQVHQEGAPSQISFRDDTPTHRIILIWDDLPPDDRGLLASSF